MRVAVLVPALLLPLVLGGLRPAEGGTAPVAGMIEGVEVRSGVQHRSLVVLPLILRDGNEGSGPPPHPPAALEWRPVAGKPDAKTVECSWSEDRPDGAPSRTALVPPGLLLEGGPRERLLSRPLIVAEGPGATTRARRTDLPPAEGKGAAAAAGRTGPVAPTDQRRVDLLLGEEESLETLLRIQAALAGLEEEDGLSVRRLLEAPALAKAVGEVAGALDPIPGSFGGSAVGHVAFLGNRALEVVLFPNPAQYRTHGPGYLRGLSLGLVLWEKYFGLEGRPIQAVDQALLLTQARRILDDLAGADAKPAMAGPGESGGGKILLVLRPATGREKAWTPSLVGRCLVGEDGKGAFLEVFEDLESVIFPSALTEPGGRPTDAPPSTRSGALTLEYLSRLLERRSRAGGSRGGK